MEIGARLKEAREAKNISLDSLQETTKIQKRYLLAIEEGNFHILPGKFYTRAFIKEYANAVGLNSNDLLEEYKEEIPKTEEESDIQYTRIQRSRKENNNDKSPAIFSIFPTIIVVLLIIGIFFVAWFLIKENMSDNDTNPQDEQDDNIIINNPDDESNSNNENDDQAADDNSSESPADSEEAADEEASDEETQTEAEFTVIEEGTGSSPESELELNNAGDEIIVTLESDGHTWLEVRDADNQAVYNAAFGEENSPHEIDMSGTDKIYFNVGNAPDLKIMINGVELEYPVDAEQYVHQRLWININNESE
ncbi:helix-turn-helix domain-containing protein [Virgibacillus indicus]|uniref:Helix-turn-helix domain-containing protein n=1 Tax=Virgibacillus indicus TaxID=2024554 RepID=A0A265NEN3_9BACI|nr:RodZ domain-containing protein [Virgibacillus indicus]OZU90255.1 helix-turn-helix domain-containing protein [Virgibacillus indicus]